jgi:uncharacterized membrane protein YhaH (DUF805 family)
MTKPRDRIATFFSLKGTASRSTYWLATLGSGLVIAASITVFARSKDWLFNISEVLLFFPARLLLIVVIVISLWGMIAVAIRRLHQRGKSGWWILWYYVASIALMRMGLVDPIARSGWAQAWGYIYDASFWVGVIGALWGLIQMGILGAKNNYNQHAD